MERSITLKKNQGQRFLAWGVLFIPHTVWHTLNHLKELGLDVQKAHKTALNLHAHSVLYAHKLSTTRRALEKSCCSQGLGLEQGAACHPPDPH